MNSQGRGQILDCWLVVSEQWLDRTHLVLASGKPGLQ